MEKLRNKDRRNVSKISNATVLKRIKDEHRKRKRGEEKAKLDWIYPESESNSKNGFEGTMEEERGIRTRKFKLLDAYIQTVPEAGAKHREIFLTHYTETKMSINIRRKYFVLPSVRLCLKKITIIIAAERNEMWN